MISKVHHEAFNCLGIPYFQELPSMTLMLRRQCTNNVMSVPEGTDINHAWHAVHVCSQVCMMVQVKIDPVTQP